MPSTLHLISRLVDVIYEHSLQVAYDKGDFTFQKIQYCFTELSHANLIHITKKPAIDTNANPNFSFYIQNISNTVYTIDNQMNIKTYTRKGIFQEWTMSSEDDYEQSSEFKKFILSKFGEHDGANCRFILDEFIKD